MAKRYDEFANNCQGCGWLREGRYLDGTPYLCCIWFGTIMHNQSEEECKSWRSPEYVLKYMNKQRKK